MSRLLTFFILIFICFASIGQSLLTRDFTLETDSILLKGKQLKSSNSYRIEITNLSQNTIVFDTLNFHFKLLTLTNNDSAFCSITNNPFELNLDEEDKTDGVFLKENKSITIERPLCGKKIRINFYFLVISTFLDDNTFTGQAHSIKWTNFYW